MSGAEHSGFDLSQWPMLLGILLAGWVLGLLFYGGLWLTTSRVLRSRHPVLWVLGGFVLRMALVLPALYWLSDARWERLLVCVAGFLIARPLVIRLSARWQAASPNATPKTPQALATATTSAQVLREEGDHASESR